MTTNDLQAELAYIRRLAEEGSVGPMRNGTTLVWAGIVYAAASVAQYAVVSGYLPQNAAISLMIWGGASLAFAVLAMVFRTGRSETADTSPSCRANAAAWNGIGLGIIGFILSLVVIANVLHEFAVVSYLVAPVVLLMYGIGWWVGAAVSGVKWVRLVAFGCFAAAPLITLLAGHPEQLLAYAASLILFATLPGLVLTRAGRG
ncbi:MAG: hypothetical protein ACXU8U_02475 [Asticcacaulis sp.]